MFDVFSQLQNVADSNRQGMLDGDFSVCNFQILLSSCHHRSEGQGRLHNDTLQVRTLLIANGKKKEKYLKGFTNKGSFVCFVHVTERARSSSESKSSPEATGLAFLPSLGSVSSLLSPFPCRLTTVKSKVPPVTLVYISIFFVDHGGKIPNRKQTP